MRFPLYPYNKFFPLRCQWDTSFTPVTYRQLAAKVAEMEIEGLDIPIAIKMRRAYLNGRKEYFLQRMHELRKDIPEAQSDLEVNLLLNHIARYQRGLKEIRVQRQSLKDKTGKGILEEDRQTALSVPIESLLLGEVRNGYAKCPFHEDKHPSLYLNENNTAYCFSCNELFNPIKLTMRLNNMNQEEAIKCLLADSNNL